jgi:signal transduction histidine kinase
MLVDDLRPLFLFKGVPDEDLGMLAAAGNEVRFGLGEVLFRQGVRADYWWVLIEGRVELLRRAGRDETVVATMSNPGQWAGGFKAWNDETGYMATGRGATPGRMFRVSGDDLGRWARGLFPLGAHLMTGVLQTVRSIEANASQREALVALGTLAAGLSHEINNPAAASARAVDALREGCDTLLNSLVGLAEGSLTATQFVELDTLRRAVNQEAVPTTTLVASREDELTEWFEDRDVADSWRIAPVLAEAGVDLGWCDQVAQILTPTTLGPGFLWVASTLSVGSILEEMKEATARVSALVAAVRSYSQLDRAQLQSIDLAEGLESTLVMLRHKLPAGITVVRDYGPGLPRIEANPALLNQVWTNLIDNAIDAMNGQGTLRLRTVTEQDAVVVEVVDDGPGMTSDVQAHAFEPFFTTKDVGKGTGLGLDIARRTIGEHRGQIAISSRPGETILRVRFPLSGQRDPCAS